MTSQPTTVEELENYHAVESETLEDVRKKYEATQEVHPIVWNWLQSILDDDLDTKKKLVTAKDQIAALKFAGDTMKEAGIKFLRSSDALVAKQQETIAELNSELAALKAPATN